MKLSKFKIWLIVILVIFFLTNLFTKTGKKLEMNFLIFSIQSSLKGYPDPFKNGYKKIYYLSALGNLIKVNSKDITREQLVQSRDE